MVEVKRSVDLDEHVRESREAVRSGNDRWFADHTAEAGDVLVYGSAPDEEWRGREAALSLTLAEGRAMNEAAGVTEDESPQFECFEADDAGWIVGHSHFKLADGSTVPTRSVTVLVRADGTWKRVFGAVHVVVPNELLIAGTPLASPAN